jgi:hypothetical protein
MMINVKKRIKKLDLMIKIIAIFAAIVKKKPYLIFKNLRHLNS